MIGKIWSYHNDLHKFHSLTDEEHIHDVLQEVVHIQAKYFQFGVQLGVPGQKLNAIRTTFNHDIFQAFYEVLLVWLRHTYSVEKYGLPTWQKLVEAVDNPAGGDNHALAKSIASHHPAISTYTNVCTSQPKKKKAHSEYTLVEAAQCGFLYK